MEARLRYEPGRRRRFYEVVELFYWVPVTDELLERRGLRYTRDQYLKSAFNWCLVSGVSYSLLVEALLYLAAAPPQLMLALAPLLFIEGFALYAIASGLRLVYPFWAPLTRAIRVVSTGLAAARLRREFAKRARVGEARRPRVSVAALTRELFGDLASKLSVIFRPEDVKRLIEAADIALPVEYLYSLLLAVAIITGASVAVALSAVITLLLGLPLWTIPVMAPISFIIGFLVGLASGFAYLTLRADSRKRRLEQDLSTWIATMMSYLSSGIPLTEALRMSNAALRPGPFRDEVSKVIRDIELLGSDVRTALVNMASRTPSVLVREVVSGLVDAIDSGDDLNDYFREIFNYVLNVRRGQIKKLISDLSFAAELFVMLFVVTPLFMAIILALLGSAGAGAVPELGYEQLLAIISYLFIPLMGVGYIVLVDSIYPRWW